MRTRPARAWRIALGVTVAGLAAGAASGVAGASAAPAAARVGLVVDTSSPDAEAVAAGLREAFRAAARGGRPWDVIERAAAAQEAETRAALAELALEGAAVVVAVGDDAARIAAEAVRDRPVVAVAAEPVETSSGRVRRVAWTPDPGRLAEEFVRLAGDARRFAVAGPVVGTADALSAALGRTRGAAEPAPPVVERLLWSDTNGAYTGDIAGAEVVVAAAETSAAEVTDLARRLAGQGAALVGTHARHLDAGAAIVLRAAPGDVGALAAAAAAAAVSDGGDAAAPVRPRRVLREVHLANARRLGWVVPLGVLASSDRTVAPARERR